MRQLRLIILGRNFWIREVDKVYSVAQSWTGSCIIKRLRTAIEVLDPRDCKDPGQPDKTGSNYLNSEHQCPTAEYQGCKI
jgi:hypothetical protein